MATLRTIIVDDEEPARKRLRKQLSAYESDGRVQVIGEAVDGVEALQLLEEEEVDLLFLDIQMPEVTGFDVLDRLPPDNRPAVVFVTAFDEYAVQAFEENAIDYLLKPIRPERLAASIERVERRRDEEGPEHSTAEKLAELLEYLDRREIGERWRPPEGTDYLEQLSIPGKDRVLVIPVEDLISAEVNDGITRLFTLSAIAGSPPKVNRHIVTYTLDGLAQRLDPGAFMRVHRSAIVQIRHIREMVSWFSGRYKLILAGGHEVIASRARSKELRDRLSL